MLNHGIHGSWHCTCIIDKGLVAATGAAAMWPHWLLNINIFHFSKQ